MGLVALVSDGLTDRQREVTILVAAGLTNDEIADRIGPVRGTVGNQVVAIVRKLGLRNRVQLAVWAVKQGLY